MKRIIQKTKGLVRGTPTAVLISAAVHAGLLLLLGGMVVFTVIKKEEKKFVPPPPVERPKMDLIKPRVKLKKTVKPKATQRILSKRTQSMPDIQLPELAGMGEGLGGGLGGFELMPDLSEMSLFGGSKSVSVGNDLEGTFYSFQYDRSGRETHIGRDQVFELLQKFHEHDWNPRVFSSYYRAPKKLYASYLMIPPFPSEFGPQSFGIQDDPNFNPLFWCVHYKGKIASRTGGRFRFRGMGDEVMIVRINKQVVIDEGWNEWAGEVTGWRSSDKDDLKYGMGHSGVTIGDWFELEAEVPVVMEVLLEEDGGTGAFMLVIEQEGEYYPENREGAPVLPVFKTAEIPASVRAEIEYTLIRGEVELEVGPTFNVY